MQTWHLMPLMKQGWTGQATIIQGSLSIGSHNHTTCGAPEATRAWQAEHMSAEGDWTLKVGSCQWILLDWTIIAVQSL